MRHFEIGIKLKEQTRNWKDCASDRIRGKNIVEQLPENIELWRDDTEYDCIIFHDYTELYIHDYTICLYDLCDKLWDYDSNILDFAREVDGVIVPNQAIKDELKKEGIESVRIVEDGHNLNKRIRKIHEGKARKVVWFGYNGNIEHFKPYIPFIKSLGLELRIISDRCDVDCDEFIKWDVNTFEQQINECDFAVLPFNNKYKTDNKDVTAWLCGLPVAKTEEDIKRFIEPWERIKYLSEVDYYKYNINDRALKIYKICAEYLVLKAKETTQKLD